MNIQPIIDELKRLYPDAMCTLDVGKDYELLVSVRLAAQCTDARVNIVTQTLFRDYPTLESFAEADLEELEAAVRPCGFYHTKAQDIKLCAQIILEKHGGRVPDTMEELLALPGVGRKSANLLLGELYRKPAVVVDTHCIRLSNRLGLVSTKDPYKAELRLLELLPPEEQLFFCHRLVHHGRAVCNARSPRCGECTLGDWCKYAKTSGIKQVGTAIGRPPKPLSEK